MDEYMKLGSTPEERILNLLFGMDSPSQDETTTMETTTKSNPMLNQPQKKQNGQSSLSNTMENTRRKYLVETPDGLFRMTKEQMEYYEEHKDEIEAKLAEEQVMEMGE